MISFLIFVERIKHIVRKSTHLFHFEFIFLSVSSTSSIFKMHIHTYIINNYVYLVVAFLSVAFVRANKFSFFLFRLAIN